MRSIHQPLSASLDADQLRAVESEAKTLRVLAGAGSGKTRVLTARVARRIADLSLDPNHTLVLTFTRKAADELRARLGKLSTDDSNGQVVTGTFHAIAYAQLRQRWLDRGRGAPVVASNPARIMGDVLDNLKLGRYTNARVVANEISWAKGRSLMPEHYVEQAELNRRRPPISSAQMEKIYAAYEVEKQKRRVVDYDDLLLLMTHALRTDKSFAATQSWQFRHFFVDEFQDLNTAQFELLQAWLGGRDDLFVVGDANQAIYGWNGADSSYLNCLDRYYPQLETIELRTNYRSSKSVLAAAQALLSDSAVPSEDADIGTLPVVRKFADETAEATGLARAVRAAHNRNHSWNDIAILVRTNSQRAVLEDELGRLGIPFRSAGGASWLYARELRAALEMLREDTSVALALRAPDIDLLAEEGDIDLDQLRSAIRSSLLADPTITVADFLAWVEVGSKFDSPPDAGHSRGGAVTVTTFHRAKGLEWPVVFLAGVEEGFVPISNIDVDEERRLFYVAITRAREELHCSWAQSRSIGNKTVTRQVSPWLASVAHSTTPDQSVSEAELHAVINEGRSKLHVDAPREDAALEALKKWRAARSKLTGVEPRFILADEVLTTIVDLRPDSVEELATIQGLGPVRAAAIGDELLALIRTAEP